MPRVENTDRDSSGTLGVTWSVSSIVAGHQDEPQPLHSLELLEQLNVNLDRIASEYHNLHPQRPYVLMSSHAKAHLVSADGTVTSKHDNFLVAQATAHPLIKYLSDKYSWSIAVVDTINWKAHGQAFKQNKLRRFHYSKLCMISSQRPERNKYDGRKQTCMPTLPASTRR
jgi:hypothetical protein